MSKEPDLGEEPRATQAVESTPAAAETASGPSSRIVGYDVARALAFIGMVAVNYRVVLDPLFSQRDPAWLNQTFSEVTGRAAALFVVLAGVGTTLLGRSTNARESWSRTLSRTLGWTLALAFAVGVIGFHAWGDSELARDYVDASLRERLGVYRVWLEGPGRGTGLIALALLALVAGLRLVAERKAPGPRTRLGARAALLLGLGYAWYPLWNGDILHYYGVFLAVGALVLKWRTRWIALFAGAVALAGFVWQIRENFTADWSMLVLEYKHFWEPRALFRNLVFNGWHPILPWLTFFLVGLLIGRGRSETRRFALGLIVVGVLCAAAGRYGAEAARDLLVDRERERIVQAFPLSAASLAEGEAVVAAAVLDDEGRPPRRSRRVGLDVRPEVDRDAAERQVTDARRLRRYLRATEKRHDFRALGLVLRPLEGGEEGELEIVVQLGEDPAVALEEGAEARFRETARAFAAWMGDRAAPPFGMAEEASFLGGGGWPGTLEHLRVQRLAPIRGTEGRLRFGAAESLVADRRDARALDREEFKYLRLAHARSWPNPSPFFLLGAGGSALALMGLCLLVTRGRLGRLLTRPFAIAGRMALTLYVAHIVLGLGLLNLIGKASGEDLPFIAFAVGVCAWVGISACCAWRAIFRLGPLEQLLRWLAR